MGSLVVEAIVISHLVQRGKQIKLVEMAAVEREDGSHGREFHRSPGATGVGHDDDGNHDYDVDGDGGSHDDVDEDGGSHDGVDVDGDDGSHDDVDEDGREFHRSPAATRVGLPLVPCGEHRLSRRSWGLKMMMVMMVTMIMMMVVMNIIMSIMMLYKGSID